MDDKLKVVNKRHHYNRLFHDLYAPTSLSRLKSPNPDEHDRCVCVCVSEREREFEIQIDSRWFVTAYVFYTIKLPTAGFDSV